MRCTLVFTAMAVLWWKSASTTNYNNLECLNLKPQYSLDLTQIMGMWYGVEKIWHTRDEIDFEYDYCPVIHLSEITYKMTTATTYIPPGGFGYNWHDTNYYSPITDVRSLRLLIYGIEGETIHYLKFDNHKKGFWIYAEPKSSYTGTSTKYAYNLFLGNIQVIKAVNDHIVLTFCHRYPKPEVFSMILSREPLQLEKKVIKGIHNLLNRRNLTTSDVQEYCNGGNISATLSYSILLIMMILLFCK